MKTKPRAPFWSGVFPAITTQLKKDQSLDLDATARHVDALIHSGVKGMIFLGSLGENQALSARKSAGCSRPWSRPSTAG